MKNHIYTADERLAVIDGGSPQLSRQLTQLRKESLKTTRLQTHDPALPVQASNQLSYQAN